MPMPNLLIFISHRESSCVSLRMRPTTFPVTGGTSQSQTPLHLILKLIMIFSFFAHLVDVLGPRDFSAAICMLLLEKSASRVIRQTPEEIQNSLSLPISVFQHVTHDLQAYVGSFIYFYAHVRPDQRFSLDRHRDIERVSTHCHAYLGF